MTILAIKMLRCLWNNVYALDWIEDVKEELAFFHLHLVWSNLIKYALSYDCFFGNRPTNKGLRTDLTIWNKSHQKKILEIMILEDYRVF